MAFLQHLSASTTTATTNPPPNSTHTTADSEKLAAVTDLPLTDLPPKYHDLTTMSEKTQTQQPDHASTHSREIFNHGATDPEKLQTQLDDDASLQSRKSYDMNNTDPEKLGVQLPDDASARSHEDSIGGGGHDLEVTKTLSRIDTADFPHGFRLAMIMLAVMLATFLFALDMTIVATAIPRITDQFHSLADVGWYGSAFFLTVAAFQATWGKAYKYFPLKTLFLIAVFIFELGSLICAVAPNSVTLIVGRAIQGAGGAGLGSGAYTILAFSAPPQQRAAFTGILGATFSIASVIGPLLGGVFTTDLSWRWCFYINLPVGGAAAAFIVIFFHTPKAARPQPATLREKLLQIDLPGSFTLMAAAVCYILAMQWGGTTKPWSSSSVIGCLVGFGLLVVLFVAIEYYSGDRALLPGRILKDRTIMSMAAYIFFTVGGFFILLYYLPIYFQSTRGVSASKSGIDNLPLVLGTGLFSMVSGGIITLTGYYVPVMIFGSAIAAVGTGLLYTLDVHTGSGQWIGYQALAAIGLGLIFQIPMIVSQSSVKPSDLSSVSAMMIFFQTIGGALYISAAQAGFSNQLLHRLPFTAPGVNAAKVVMTGATQLRSVFSAEQIPGILEAYMDGLRVPIAIAIACCCMSAVLAFTPPWKKIKVDLSAGPA